MSGIPTSQPSWQSQQRQGGAPLPTSQSSYDNQSQQRQQQQQSWRPNGSRNEPTPQRQPFPTSQPRDRPSTATSSGTGAPIQSNNMNRSSSYGNQLNSAGQENGGASSPVPSQSSQQQVHRRTQSLRPMSAFQPLEHVDSGYQVGNAGGTNGQRPSSPTGSTTRSIRTAAAPLTFKSPELRSALGLQDAQSKKIYMEGYLSRRDHLNAEGRPLNMADPKKRWHLCFVQLSGTVLSVWSVQQMEEAARQGTEVPPTYINITDCFVDYIGTITETPQEVPGTRGRYENVFAVNTAGQNRILFGVEGAVGRRLVQAWVNGIRLASWEKVRLEEIYTGSLVRARLGAVSAQQATSGPGGAPGDVEMSIKSPLSKGGRMEGWVKARFMGTTEWKKCWLVLTDKGAEGAAITADAKAETASVTSGKSSFWSKLKAGDRSSFIGSPSTPSLADTGLSGIEVPPGSNGAPGLACFFDSKKTKKPFATLAYASHAFAVYPSRPELVEGSSLFKVEGSFPLSSTISATNRNRQTGWVMIMPELENQSSKGANAEMMKWCIAFMDAFRLYGRPTQFQWDARNPVSPFFAYPIGPYKDRLFLDRELAEFLDIREERHLANRNNLHGIMSARMRGERTPILPPLPQPNAESTRNLNGPQGQDGNGTIDGKSLPPLNFGEKGNSAGGVAAAAIAPSSSGPLNASGDSPFASRGALDSIGERSREGSVMTTLNTPVTPIGNDVGDGKQLSQYNQSGPIGEPNHKLVESAGVGDVAAKALGGSDSTTTTNGQQQPARSSSVSGGKGPGSALSYLSPSTSAATSRPEREPSPVGSFSTADQAPSAAVFETVGTSSSPPPPAPEKTGSAAPMLIPQNQNRTLQASGRGAEANDSSISTGGGTAVPAIIRKTSDPYGSYDEGALYYINSMGDQLPTVSQQQSNTRQAATNETPPTTAAAAAHSQQLNSHSQAGSTSEHSTAYNHRSQASQPSSTTLSAPTSRQAAALRPMSTQVDGIDQDALTAYSFLDQPPSPNLSKNATLPSDNIEANNAAKNGTGAAAPAIALVQQPPQSYPSTFGGNKKAQERKMALQSQEQAHQDALTRPGRGAGGAKKGLKQVGGQRHAWADESEDEEEEEEDEDDEEEESRVKTNDDIPAQVNASNVRGDTQAVPGSGRFGPSQPSQTTFVAPPSSSSSPSLYNNNNVQRQTQLGTASPQMQPPYAQQSQYGQIPSRQSLFNQHLGSNHDETRTGTQNYSPYLDQASQQRNNTFVQLSQEEQPGAMTAAFQPHGLLQAGAQDKVERSAKQQEAFARSEGTHMVNVDSKPPPPQAGLLGAITAHERDRKKDGGLGATLTERERGRVQAEQRQREEDLIRMQQQQQMQMQQQQQQMMAGGQQPAGWGGPPGGGMPFNPMMWQQMQMMSMMNPQMMMSPMFGGQGSGSQIGHGGAAGAPSPEALAAQQQAQMMAAQAAQQAYIQALSQHGGSVMSGEGGGGGSPPPMPPHSMGMMPFNPYMSMYGAPSMTGFSGFMPPMGSDVGQQMTASPSPNLRNRSQERLNSNNSPLRR